MRGHRLVADDAVEIRRVSNQLIGTAPEVIRHYIELRGIGVIDVRELFGMAYVTLEDDTASLEMLCFARTLDTCGSYLQENQAIGVRGRLSVRDEKAPQLLCDSAYPLQADEGGEPSPPPPPDPEGKILSGKALCLLFPGAESPELQHMKLVFSMFPGTTPVRMRMADTRKVLGTTCLLHKALLEELKETIGSDNIVIQ